VADALIATHAAIAAAHHARYTDAETNARVTALAILKSLLTTEGDLVIRGNTVAERLAKITTGYLLRATATGYDGLDSAAFITPLTVALFQVNAATGDMDTPAAINDDNTGTLAFADTVGKYAEVDFGAAYHIREYRHSGTTDNNGDGKWKIQYWDGDSWEDWQTNISTRNAVTWSSWSAPTLGMRSTTKIRLVCTALDTRPAPDKSYIGELEIRAF
ncbi:unnamed protein product, partial [marine sediment metagenome]